MFVSTPGFCVFIVCWAQTCIISWMFSWYCRNRFLCEWANWNPVATNHIYISSSDVTIHKQEQSQKSQCFRSDGLNRDRFYTNTNVLRQISLSYVISGNKERSMLGIVNGTCGFSCFTKAYGKCISTHTHTHTPVYLLRVWSVKWKLVLAFILPKRLFS